MAITSEKHCMTTPCRNMQKPLCRKVLHPKLECCIVRVGSSHWLQYAHHFGEALCVLPRQKLGCMIFLLVEYLLQCEKVPRVTAQPSLRRSTVRNAPAETWVYQVPSSKDGMLHCPSLWSPQATTWPSLLRSPVYMTLLHPKVECRTDQSHSFHKPQRDRHCEEAPCEFEYL